MHETMYKQCRTCAPIYPQKKNNKKKGNLGTNYHQLHACTRRRQIVRGRAGIDSRARIEETGKRGARQVSRQEKREVIPVGPEADVAGGAASSAVPGAPAALATEFGAPCISCVPLPHRGRPGNLPCPDPAWRPLARTRRRRHCDQRQARQQRGQITSGLAGATAVCNTNTRRAAYYHASTPRRSLRTNELAYHQLAGAASPEFRGQKQKGAAPHCAHHLFVPLQLWVYDPGPRAT